MQARAKDIYAQLLQCSPGVVGCAVRQLQWGTRGGAPDASVLLSRSFCFCCFTWSEQGLGGHDQIEGSGVGDGG